MDKEYKEEHMMEDVAAGKKVKQTKRHLGPFQLMMMVYFLSSGGPYGIEPAISAGGPLLTMIGVVVVCLCWSLPQALMSAELSQMDGMDINGGNIVWVLKPFGYPLAWLNAYGSLIAYLANQGIYVAVYLSYFGTKPPFDNWWVQFALNFSFCFLVGILNIWGVRWISKLSVPITAVIWAPFFIEIIYLCLPSFQKVDPTVWKGLLFIPDKIQWNILISTAVWAMDGFDMSGSLAGEVIGGRKSFLLGVLGSFPLVFVNYVLPVVVGFLIFPDASAWQSGFFVVVAGVCSTWMGKFTLASSIVNNFSQYNASLAAIARQIWAMSHGEESGEGIPQFLPRFLGASWTRKTGTIRPLVPILVASLIPFGLQFLPLKGGSNAVYEFLVQVYFGLRILSLTLEYAALIALRIQQPNANRPFKNPGGLPVALLLPVGSLVLGGLSFYYTAKDSLTVIWTTLGSIAVIMALWLGVFIVGRCRQTRGYHPIND